MTSKTNEFEGLKERTGITPKKKELYREAFTHRSFLNENPERATRHNERLEYLGDAVLELVVTTFLFNKYPEKQEGELTSIRAALVNHIMLSQVAEEVGLEAFMLLSKGEAKDSGRAKQAILANAVEALIGAIYLDQGLETAGKIINQKKLIYLAEGVEKELFIDSKSLLQEIIQEELKLTPTYKITEENGPDHNKEFIAGVFFGETFIEKGRGFSKQEAERDAAGNALKKWKNTAKSAS